MGDRSPKGTLENTKIIQEQLLGLRNDLASPNEHVRSAAESMLDALLVLSKVEVDKEVIRMIADSSTGSPVQKSLIKAYKKRLTCAAMKGQEFIQCVSEWKDFNSQKLMDMLESIFVKSVPKETCKSLFLTDVLPTMFSAHTNNDVRSILIEVSSMLAVIVPISTLTSVELEAFLKNMAQKYVISIEKLRDEDYTNWDKLLIFLIKYCSVNLHNSIQLTNKVLRVVEFAFKNSSIDQRIKGYACWKEIINNASQNLSYFHGRKQIKLLVTPLKANFSKQGVVICKRFELFVYLMEKLQEKAVLCLSDFLQFQFGALDDDNQIRKKIGQGKNVPKLLVPGTKVLIALMGHSHGKNVECLSTEDTIRFNDPVITHLNFQTFHKPIMHSIGDCCILLKDVDEDIDREKVVKCLWKSLFDLVLPALGENKTSYFIMVSHVFNVFLNHLNTDTYFQNLLKWVLSTFTLYEKKLVHELFKYLLGSILISLSITPNLASEEVVAIKEIFSYMVSKITVHEEKLTVIQNIISVIVSPGYGVPNAYNIKYIWTSLVEELVTNLSVECIEKFEKYEEFFMWPLYNLHHLDEVKKHILVEWFKLYRKMATDDSKKLRILNSLRLAFKNNPLLVSNIISLLEVMTQYEIKSSKDYVLKLMKVIISISELPTLVGEDEQKVTNMLGQNLDLNVDLLKKEESDEIIECIYQCVERLLTVRKNFKILETFAAFLKKSPETIRKKFSTLMSNFLQELLDKELVVNSYNAKELQKVLSLLCTKSEEKKEFVLPSGRSAKIARLAKKLPKSPDKRSRSSESTLRLFGTDPETMSPIRVKGSQLNNTPIGKTTKPDSNVPKKEIIEENSEDFVHIDTKVKFQPHKMPEHLKEAMRKKREDIPALYQDLSQSNSQDLFGFRSNSNSGNGTKLPKVIVERIDSGYIGYINPNLKVEEDLTQVDEDLLKKIEQNKTKTSSNLSRSPDKSDCTNSKDLNNMSGKKSEKKSSPKSPTANIPDIPTSTEKETEATPEDDFKEGQFNISSTQRKRATSELSRLKMDIVGAENYTSAPRRTRPKNSARRFSLASGNRSPEKNDGLNQNETPKTHKRQRSSLSKRGKLHGNKTEQTSEKEAQECKMKRKRNVDNDDDIIESSQKPYDITPLNSPRKQQTDINSSTLVQQKTVTDKDFVEGSDISSKKIISETQNTVAETQTQDNFSESPEEHILNTTQDTTATQESDMSVSHEVVKGDVSTQCSDRTTSQDTITQPTQDSTLESQEAKAPTLYFDLPKKPVALTDSEQFQCRMDTMSICLDLTNPKDIIKEENAAITDNNDALGPYQSIPSSPVTPDTPSKTSTLLSDTIDISPINSDDSNDVSQQETCSSLNQFNKFDLKSSGDEQIPERSSNEANQEKITSPQKSISGTMNVRSSKLLNMIHISSPTIRRIKRRSGNSSLSPSSGSILKYMYNNLRANSPPAEEDDFLTFSREIPSPLAIPRSGILKRKLSDMSDGDGISPCAKRKRVNFSDPCLTSKKLFIKDDFENDTENDETENGDVETEPNEEIIYPSLIRKDKPLYPNLIDCDDDISLISQKMTTPALSKSLTTQFQLDGIKTVGDLAQLDETEIKRFPFKSPPMKTVYNVLERYWKRKHLNKSNKWSKSDDKKTEIEEELKQLMQKAAVMNISPEHLAKTLLSNLDEHQVFPIFKTFNFSLKCLLEGQDLEAVARCVLSRLDTCKSIELLNQNCGSVALRKNLLNKFSLTELLAEKTVTELKASITELVKDDPIKKEDLVENCLLPLIRTPKDISGYLNKLSVVDLEDMVFERFQFDDLERFLHKLSTKFENKLLVVNVLMQPEDVTKTFKTCLASQLGKNDQEKIMIDMYRFIGEHLSLENLISLHAEFLKRIPNLYVKRNE